MNNNKTATIISFSDINEEDITLSIDGTIINCFINSCPYALETGRTYAVELTISLSDDYQIEISNQIKPSVEKTADGYAYFLWGELSDSIFKTFTDLHDEDIHYDHPELNNHFIKLKADRINVNFL